MPDNRPPLPVRKLIITGCKVGYQGQNDKGSYTIYEVDATTDQGQPVTQKLRSFEELELTGQPVEFTLQKYDSEKYGTSFTLSRKDKPNAHKRIDELKQYVVELEGRLRAMEARVYTGTVAQPVPVAAPPPVAVEVPPPVQAPPQAPAAAPLTSEEQSLLQQTQADADAAQQASLDQRFGTTDDVPF